MDEPQIGGPKPQKKIIAKNDTDQRRNPTKPNCMRPCPPTLTPATKSTDEKNKSQFNTQRRGGPIGRRQPPPEPQKHPDGRLIRQPFEGQAHLYEVIQVRLARTQRLVEVNTNDLRLAPNTPVLVRVHRNILLATTVGVRKRRVAEINSLPFVVRIASEKDRAIDAENALIEKKAQVLATGYAIENNLQMKVLSADISHDHKNITINFASDVRVDFRNMVAFLASQLKLRVEMYQLGLRNGTGLICGLGSCGQLLCCGRFLGQFDPVAVKQLRAQGLAANPKRISGVCGRLYCCMSYEYFDYMREQRTLPRKGKRVFTRWGIGRITDIDMLREDIVVTYDNGEVQRITHQDLLPVTDEILAKVEADEIEFPLEPARFYLNHDPSSACEMETKTQLRTAQPHPRSNKSTPHNPTVTHGHDKVQDTEKKRALPTAGSIHPVQKKSSSIKSSRASSRGTVSPNTAQRQHSPKKSDTLTKQNRPTVQALPAVTPDKPAAQALPAVTPNKPAVQASPAATPHQVRKTRPVRDTVPTRNATKPDNTAQMAHVPRKVNPKNANLDDGNPPPKRSPGRPSRRRYPPRPNPTT